MRVVLVTGYDGVLGRALTCRLLAEGYKVYGLSRRVSFTVEGVIPMRGDILEENLGLQEAIDGIDTVYHLAALAKLGNDDNGMIWQTNVQGTERVVTYCKAHGISDLKFCSTAYCLGRSAYENSKASAEILVTQSGIPKVTIFKPSIIMGSHTQHFSQFVVLLIKLHKRAELIRRYLEGTLRLPVIEPVFRLRGKPEGRLNLIQVEYVAEAMARIQETGTFWLTHPAPSTLEEITRWVGEFILVRLTMVPEFKAMPIEAVFHRLAASFVPYLKGDDFRSDLKGVPSITREFIHEELKRSLDVV